MMATSYASKAEIETVHATLNKTFHSGVTIPLAYRRKQLLQLARLVQENSTLLYDAIHADWGKPKLEVAIAELGPIVGACINAAEKLEEWTKPESPEKPPWRSSYDISIHNVPHGVTVIISPWNYPYVISLAPLVGAIAAGCVAVIKPSEHAPAVAKALVDLFPKYMDPNAYTVLVGAIAETTHILELRWDYIFFTGGEGVGKIIAAAAAKHVTPHTLELGGQNPAVIDDDVDLALAAKRILWGKKQSGGQICVAPDYILVPRHRQDGLVKAFKEVYASFYPEGALKSPDTARIISPLHYKRITDLIAGTKGQIVTGGTGDGQKIDLTVVRDVPLDDVLMQNEIFGPVLSIIPVDSVDEAVRIIRTRPTPLAVYLFSDDKDLKTKFIHSTRSGSLIINDTVQQVGVPEIPFGGFGSSGHGSYLGKHSFDTFNFKKSYMDVPASAEALIGHRYPPYTTEGFDFFHSLVEATIPVE